MGQHDLLLRMRNDAKVNKKAMRRGAYDERPTRYNLAKVGYYRLKTATDERNGEGWHNYAMCLQLAFKEYDAAQDAYIQAILRAREETELARDEGGFLSALDEIDDEMSTPEEEVSTNDAASENSSS